jgi:dihydroorotate dehydrogenase (fumarate)
MIKLNTKYLGLDLKSPLVVSAGPLCKDLDNLKKMEDAHASAIVLHSLFEEQIDLEANNLDDSMWASAEMSAESSSYYPELATAAPLGPQEYLEHIRKAKKSLGIPVIASLNGESKGGWTKYAKLMQEAGADALELNIYYLATDPTASGADIEKRYVELVQEVKKSITIPVAVKLGPYFSAMANLGKQLDDAGADALVLFNRFYQPDFDLEALEAVPRLVLSRSSELTLRLHWVAVLFGKIKADLAVTGGVHVAEDVVKAMMAGGKIAMMTSALLEQGIGYLHVLENHLIDWMDKHEYESIEQMQGSMSYKNVAHPAAFERANYLKVLNSYSLGLPVR